VYLQQPLTLDDLNETYTLSLWYKATGSFMFYVSVADADWHTIDTWRSELYPPSVSVWTYIEITVGPIPSQVNAWVSFDLDSNGEFQIDDVSLTVSRPSKNGEIFLWVGFWLVDGNGNPNEAAQRIVDAKTEYGNPTWIEAGNWMGPHLTSELINLFHSAGIKVSCRLWSRGTIDPSPVPLDIMKYDMNVQNGYGGSIDYQLSIGPEIDMFMIDECKENDPAYYQDLSNYVHSKGKLFAVNPGGEHLQDQTALYSNKMSCEFAWREFIANNPLVNQYPKKFIGVAMDWGYQYFPPIGRQVTLETAVADTIEAWNGGVYYFDSRPDGSYLPDWWEEYLSQLQGYR